MRRYTPAFFTMLFCTSAFAEVLAIRGATDVQLQEFLFNEPGDLEEVSEDFPGTSDELPIAAVTKLVALDPEEAAGSVAALFADPTELDQPNPEEFAMNFALSSVTPHTYYEALAASSEERDIVFSSAEIVGTQDGDEIELIGRLFLDGALTIFAAESAKDISNVDVTLRVTVTKIASDETETTVFEGTVTLAGAADGQVTIEADGDLPTDTLVLSDLSVLNPDFGVFQVLIIPPMELDYQYDAVVGEQFTLAAKFQVEGRNDVDGIGCAAIIGTPVDSLNEVIALTADAATANMMQRQIRQERDAPTGTLVFQPQTPTFGLCPAAGLFSLGMLAFGIFVTRRP